MRLTGWIVAALAALPLLSAPVALAERPTVIKLCSLVPDGSVWDKALREMGAEWASSTQGRVTARIFPGGIAGDEPVFVRKMRIGQFQAAAITTSGLAEIDPAFKMFEIPMFFESYDELHAVLEKLEPTLKQRLADKGFRLLSWGHGGWVYFFTKDKVATVADMRKAKMFWLPDDRMVQLWKKNGFTPVPLAATDILTGMQTGMIDTYPSTPLLVLALQWYKFTPNMVAVGMAPLVGGLVMTEKAWKSIGPEDQPKVLAACERLGDKLAVEIPRQDTTAVAEMQKRGLTVTTVTRTETQTWREVADKFAADMRGTVVPTEILDAATRERDAYRAKHGRASH